MENGSLLFCIMIRQVHINLIVILICWLFLYSFVSLLDDVIQLLHHWDMPLAIRLALDSAVRSFFFFILDSCTELLKTLFERRIL